MPRADSSAHSIRVFVAVIGAAATIIAALIAANAKAPRQAEAPPLPSGRRKIRAHRQGVRCASPVRARRVAPVSYTHLTLPTKRIV